MFRGYVVEGDSPARGALVECLAELAGVTTVGCAGDEQTATAWLTDAANDWDIAIVDLRLDAGGSGFGVLKALMRRQAHQRVVVWTAASDEGSTRRSRAYGAEMVFDRAAGSSELMDFCFAASQAQVRAAGTLNRSAAAFSKPAADGARTAAA